MRLRCEIFRESRNTVVVWVATAKNNGKWDCLDRVECRKEDVPIGREATLFWYATIPRNTA